MMKFNRTFPPSMFSFYEDELNNIIAECEASGRLVHIMVEPEKKRRTTGSGSQSHHLNGHIQQIAMATGQPFEDIKKYVKQKGISQGYPMLMRFGRPLEDLWGNPLGISETEATVQECSILIDVTHRLAAELGIILQEAYGAY